MLAYVRDGFTAANGDSDAYAGALHDSPEVERSGPSHFGDRDLSLCSRCLKDRWVFSQFDRPILGPLGDEPATTCIMFYLVYTCRH
jgi:hypothetical protein